MGRSDDGPPRVQDGPLSIDALLAGSERDDCGALAVFVGTVRDHNEGRAVDRLVYTAHEPIAEKVIRALELEVARRHGVPVVRVVHRVGELAVGDPAIVAVTRSAHRAEAFDALRDVVEAVKHQAPIWKEEFYADGTSEFVTGCSIADGTSDPTPGPGR
jgi:molybdopterin synthase catalytic subunit